MKRLFGNQESYQAIFVIILFLAYTIFVPTMSLSWPIKLVIDLCLLVFVVYVYQDDFKNALRKTKKHFGKFIGIVFLFWLISSVATALINMGIKAVFDIMPTNNEAQLQMLKSTPAYLLFSMLIFSPLVEELSLTKSFRVILKNKALYLILSSFVCGFLYVAFSSNTVSYVFLISYFIQAFIWALAYLKSDNILVPVSIHLLQNILVLIGYIGL